MKEKDDEIIKVDDSQNMKIRINDEDDLVKEKKKSLDEQNKRLKDKTAAEVFEEMQAKKYGPKKAKSTETAQERNARLEKTLAAARKNVATQMADKKKKKNYDRAVIRSRMLVNNKEFWDQMRKDPDSDFMATEEEKKQERELIEREFIAAKLQHKANLLAMIIGNDKLMNDPDLAAIMKEITAMEDLFAQPINDLADTVELSTAYGHLLAHMGTYIDKHQKEKKSEGMKHVTELFGLIQDEQDRLNHDLDTWNQKGELPTSIQTGSDIIERKHIGRMYEGKGRHDLIRTKIKIFSLKRENGDDDSPTMKAVKDALRGLSYALKVQINFSDEQDGFKRQQDYVRKKYDDLLLACNNYITKHKNPHTDDGKERKAVIEELLISARNSRISVPAAARSYKKWNNVEEAKGQFDGAQWVDAYSSSEKVKRHVVERLVASDKPGIDLNEIYFKEQQEKLQAEYEAEIKRIKDEEKASGAAEEKRQRDLFRKRYKPNFEAREYFLKYGIWDPNAKEGQKPEEGQQPAERWVIGEYNIPLAELLKNLDDDIITDEEFKNELLRMNHNAVQNDDWLQDPENLATLRNRFLRSFEEVCDMKTEKGKTEYNEFAALIGINYEEIDKEIVTFYRKSLNFARATQENGAKFFLTDGFVRNDTFVKLVQPINKRRKRLAKLEKDLGLSKRGDIYKTDTIKYLMFSDKAEAGYKENLKALKKQTEGNEKMLKDLVDRKFSSLTSDHIYRGLIEFLGDKTLFLTHRQLRTYADSYLRVLNVTDKETMRLERDFNEAYAATVKGPFAKYLKPYVAEYLRTKPYATFDRVGVKDRKKAMKKDLAMVAVVNEAFLNATADAEMTEAGWKRLTELAGQFIKKELYKAQNVDVKAHEKEKENRKGYEWALKENFEWNKGTEEYIQIDLEKKLRAEVKEEVEKKSAEDIQKRIAEITVRERKEFDKLVADTNHMYAPGALDKAWADRLQAALDKEFDNEKQNAVFEENYKKAIKKIPKERRKEIEKDQREKAMKQYLKDYQVADFKDYFERGLISQEEYVKALNEANDYKGYKELGLITPEEFSERLQGYIERTIKNNNKKPENKDKQKISRNAFFHEREVAEKKKAPILVDGDYSYANMFKTSGVLESEEVKTAIPDEKMRKFLGDNIGALLIGNPSLIAKFPFMKGVKGLDQLDNLTYGQFELVMNEIKNHIINDKNKDALTTVLGEKNSKKQEVLLLNFVKNGLDAEGVAKVGKEFDERKKKKALLDRQRRLIELGGKYQPRDGKIRFRFEDLPDREKGKLSSWFGKGKGWLVQRQKRFENASRVWNELEKIGPEAVEQVRKWIMYAYMNGEGDFGKIKTELNNLSKMMTLSDTELNKQRIYYTVDDKIEERFIARHKEKTGFSTEMVSGDLMKLIKNAFVSIGEKTPIEFFDEDVVKNKKIDKAQKNLMNVSNFMLEMSLLNTQDVIFGHDGVGMQDFFTYNGSEKDDEYDQKLMKWAQEAQNRVTLMDSHLKDFKKNPKLYRELSDKLIKRYMEMDVKQDAVKEKYLSDCGKRYQFYRDKYRTVSKDYTDTAKVFQAFLKENGNKATAKIDPNDPNKEMLEIEQKALIAQIEDFNNKNDAYLKELQEIGEKLTKYEKAREETIKELYQMDSKRSMQDAIKDNINADGTYSDEMCDLLEIYESRKRLLTQYGKGELASLWDAFEKDDDTFMALMDPVESVAMKKIQELHAKVGPLGESVALQYDYVGRFFLEENLPAILKGTSPLLEDIRNVEDFDKQKKHWDFQLLQFQNKYLAQKKQNTKSINENITEARSGLVKGLAKYLYYNESSIDMDTKNQKKMFRKWWFFESHNYGTDKLLEKDTSSRSMIAMNHASNIVKTFVEGNLHNSTDMLQYATNLGSLKDYYSKTVLPRIIENDKMAERAFLRYVMEEEYNKKPQEAKPDMFNPHPGLTDNEIMEALAQLSAEEQAKIEGRLVEFKDNIRAKMVDLSEDEFAANADKYAKEFVEDTQKALEEDFSFTEEHRKAAKEREKKRDDARTKVKIEKSKGRTAYNDKLFSGKLDMLKEFGEKKQSIVYVPNKEKMAKMIKSKGELKDDKLFEQAMEQFIRIDGGEPYPDILAELLDEYCRIHDRFLENLDKNTDWIIGKEKDVVTETRRLKFIYEGAKRNNVPMEYMNFAITYAAKFARKDGVADKLEDSILLNKDVDKAMKDAVRGLTKISELEAIPVSNRALKLAHTDSIEKLKAWMFATEEKDERMFQELDGMVDRQKNYYMYADQAYAVLDKVIEEDGYIGGLDNIYKTRYINAMHDYFTERIINESENYLSGEKNLDAKALEKDAKALIKDEWARDALVMEKNSVSNKDFESEHVFAGQLSRGDFERALVMSKKKDLIRAYNELDDDQRQILAMGMYLSTTHDRGSSNVIYKQQDGDRQEQRDQLMKYIGGEQVKFTVDYGRAVRALQAQSRGYKLSADTELFNKALDFTKMISAKKEQLRPKDWDKITDSYHSMLEGDKYRYNIAGEYKGIVNNLDVSRSGDLNTAQDFFSMLEDLHISDRQREKDQGKIGSFIRHIKQTKEGSKVNDVIARISKYTNTQQSLLIYLLQDRSALDYTSAGKDPVTGILAHANSEKRFKLYEKLLTDEGRNEAAEQSADPDIYQTALNTLLSFQIRDDVELGNKLKESDFVSSSLHRLEAIDWELLTHACDFLDEIESERNKKVMLAHVGDEVKNASYDSTKKLDKMSHLEKRAYFYDSRKSAVARQFQGQFAEGFTSAMLGAYEYDRDSLGVEGDDLMGAFMALDDAEKALFIKALQNRDILDISQKNLYKNVFGIAERDFVDVKGRDTLIDEYLESSRTGSMGMMRVEDADFDKALLNLCTVQINDDMDFSQMHDEEWIEKNVGVNNQLAVFRRNTILDWKLFKRALQFVTRAVNEKKMAAGDEELYRALGDQSNGEMKMDRRYLRRNLHHTGSRFLRFLGKEGLDTVSANLGQVGTLANIAEFVVSKKTANFLHEEANEIMGLKTEKADALWAKEEEQKKDEDEQEHTAFLGDLANMALRFDENKRKIKGLVGKVSDTVEDATGYRSFASAKDREAAAKRRRMEGEKKKDALDEKIGDLEEKRVDKLKEDEQRAEEIKVTGIKYLDIVLRYADMAQGVNGLLDKYLVDNPQMLETVDKYIESYLGGFMSVKTLGGYYNTASSWTKDKTAYLAQVCLDNHIPDAVKNICNKTLEVLEQSGEFLEVVGKYVDGGSKMIGDFMDIVSSVSNIKKLNAGKKQAAEKREADDAKIAGVDAKQFDKELIKFAQGNNNALLSLTNDLSKNQAGRKILSSIGSISQNVAKYVSYANAKAMDVSKILGAAFRTADFIWKCFADNKTVYNYYSTEGNPVLTKLVTGKGALHNTAVGQKHMKDENHYSDREGKMEVGRQEFRLVRNGQGFETDEEIADYLKLNMVHSLIFSASKFNPLEESRILAQCTLSILGIPDNEIGQTDSDAALRIYNKLKA